MTTKVLSSATILLGSHPICFCLQIRRTGRGIGLHNKATIFVSTIKRTIERIFGLHRAHFRYQVSSSCSSKLLQIAKDFVAKNLGPFFVSVHIRTKKMLVKGKNLSEIKQCISNLMTHVQSIMTARKQLQSSGPIPAFLACDFEQFGSDSLAAKSLRKHAKSLTEICSRSESSVLVTGA